uniref:Uncharacterized protein n=1 Tax=Lepeophtheirus salmonis TaxID=72036 RepID=A0A0K2TZ70_LEPSM
MNFYMAWILFAFIIPNSYGNKKIFKLPKNFKDCKDDTSRSMEQEFECILAVLKRMEGVLETYTYWSLREEDFVDDSEDDIWVGCAVSDPFKQDPHICIFPSGRWANPEEFAIGPFTFHTFTESKPWYESIFALFVDNTYNSWTVNPHEKYLKTPSNFISLCMFNLYGANLQEPWKDLATFDTGFWGPVTRCKFSFNRVLNTLELYSGILYKFARRSCFLFQSRNWRQRRRIFEIQFSQPFRIRK